MSNGLINLQTDLKSLRYGSDRPYITKDIDNPPSSNRTGMQIQKRLDDTSRIVQMLKDRPGIKFLANQALLQQVDVAGKLDKGNSLGSAALKVLKDTVIGTAKVALSTLAQVPVNGTGTHFVQGFRTNTYLQPVGGNTRSGFAQFFGAGGVEGAPYALRGEAIPGQSDSAFVDKQDPLGKVQNPKNGSSSVFSYAAPIRDNSTSFDFNWNEVPNISIPESLPSQYSSAIAKDGGVINVTKKEGTESTTEETTEKIEQSRTNKLTQTDALEFKKISGTEPNESGKKESYNPQLPRESTYLVQKQAVLSKNGNITKEVRVNLGDQGTKNVDGNYEEAKKLNYYWKKSTNGLEVDTVNSLDIRKTRADGEKEARDLAKLYFEIITPDETRFLYFRAFIDSFDDNYSGTWNGHKYAGRAESFYTYGGFDRDITLSFKIAPATRSELKPLYKKMVYLASVTAPTYGSAGLMRGTLAKMTVGSYLSETPGIITSVKYSLVDNTPWEIAMREPEDIEKDIQVLPMVIQCSISFKPIHNFTPQTGLYHYITNPAPDVSFFSEGDKL